MTKILLGKSLEKANFLKLSQEFRAAYPKARVQLLNAGGRFVIMGGPTDDETDMIVGLYHVVREHEEIFTKTQAFAVEQWNIAAVKAKAAQWRRVAAQIKGAA